jgi:uncharacterized protein
MARAIRETRIPGKAPLDAGNNVATLKIGFRGRAVEFEWDEAKSEWNRVERGFGFEIVSAFDWEGSITRLSPRGDELRFISIGMTAVGLVAVVWTKRQNRARVISARRVHQKEALKHGFKET